MDNTNNNFNNLNGEQGNAPIESSNQQSFQPTPVPPVYSNQYPPQYSPYVHTAPHYTAPCAPYNQGFVPNNPQSVQSPSEIYNNTQQGSAPQYHYGAPMSNPGFNQAYYQEQLQKNLIRKKAEKKIRNIGNLSGALLIGCMIVAFIFSVLLFIPSVYDFYESSLSGQSFINMIYTLTVVGGTFLIFGKFFKQHGKEQALGNGGIDVYEFKTKLSAPKSPLKAFLLIMISFGGCMLANFISSILLTFLEGVGLQSTYSSIEDPKTVTDLVLMCISIAIIPALIEEFALRGVVLSSLRRYGNGFAIITSAFMFGIFHGDVAQIPFAFICGIFFAYAVIATESLWTGIIIHAMNNSLSCISSVLMQVADEETANTFFYVVSLGGIVVAFICLFIYVAVYKRNILTQPVTPYGKAPAPVYVDDVLNYKGDANQLTLSQKLAKFFTSPFMIVAIVLYFLQALTTLIPTK